MHWIIQNNLLNTGDLAELHEQLERSQTPYTNVKLVPFFRIIEPDVHIENEPIFVCGSTFLGEVAANKGWRPGYFGDNLDYRLYIQHYGKHLLNHDAVVGTLGQIDKHWERFFIRPITDKKSFSGEVMTWDSLLQMRENVAKVDDEPDATLRTSDLIVMAPLKTIYAEYRFFIVDGRIVTGSRYKLGDRVLYASQIDEHIRQYAQARVNDWQPSRAFVMDIAETDEGLKVIELNAINSSGFYACNIGLFVQAINDMVF